MAAERIAVTLNHSRRGSLMQVSATQHASRSVGHLRPGRFLAVATVAAALLVPGLLSPVTAAEETGNNLSVPAHFIDDGGPAHSCASQATPPSGNPVKYPNSSSDPGALDGWFYVQGINTWSAACDNARPSGVTYTWGANLTNNQTIRGKGPIRVEMVLGDESEMEGEGYRVEKLEPALEDRLSDYGIRAVGDPPAPPEPKTDLEYLVWAPQAKLTIQKWVDGAWGTCPVCFFEQPMGAEINATGKVVYGYNWVVGRRNTGDYRLRFKADDVYESGWQEITIDRSGGGGGGKGGGGNGGGGKH